MAKKRKILEKILAGSKNVRFDEFMTLLEAYGFVLVRIRGSHRVFSHPDTLELLSIQPKKDGKAKPYQMRQFLKMVEEYNLHLDEEEDEA